jgi:hypothetical protein
MSPRLESFGVLSLNVIAGATSDNSDFSLQLPAANLQAKSPAVMSPLEQLMERRPDPLADTHEWHHGGINE